MMEKQAAEQSSYYFHRAAFPTRCGLDKGSLSKWSEDDRQVLYAPYQEAFEKLQVEFGAADRKVRKAMV